MKKLTVLYKEVAEDFKVVTINDSLEEFQKLVGGYIEVVQITSDILLIVNEEGKLDDLPVNFALASGTNILDTINGNVFFASTLGENLASLDKTQMQYIKTLFTPKLEALVMPERTV